MRMHRSDGARRILVHSSPPARHSGAPVKPSELGAQSSALADIRHYVMLKERRVPYCRVTGLIVMSGPFQYCIGSEGLTAGAKARAKRGRFPNRPNA